MSLRSPLEPAPGCQDASGALGLGRARLPLHDIHCEPDAGKSSSSYGVLGSLDGQLAESQHAGPGVLPHLSTMEPPQALATNHEGEVRPYSEVPSTVHSISQNRIGEGAPSSAGPPSTAAAANLSPAVSSISEWRSITCLTGMIKVFLVVMAEELRKSAAAMSMITLLPKMVSGEIDNAHRQPWARCRSLAAIRASSHHSRKAMPTQTRLGVQSAQPGLRLGWHPANDDVGSPSQGFAGQSMTGSG